MGLVGLSLAFFQELRVKDAGLEDVVLGLEMAAKGFSTEDLSTVIALDVTVLQVEGSVEAQPTAGVALLR